LKEKPAIACRGGRAVGTDSYARGGHAFYGGFSAALHRHRRMRHGAID
jgi:hypothetical protein